MYLVSPWDVKSSRTKSNPPKTITEKLAEKKELKERRPSFIKLYNKRMNAVDLVDSSVGMYLPTHRNFKWKRACSDAFFKMIMNNSLVIWNDVKEDQSKKMSLLSFTEVLIQNQCGFNLYNK